MFHDSMSGKSLTQDTAACETPSDPGNNIVELF
jgi:hypothetical protein